MADWGTCGKLGQPVRTDCCLLESKRLVFGDFVNTGPRGPQALIWAIRKFGPVGSDFFLPGEQDRPTGGEILLGGPALCPATHGNPDSTWPSAGHGKTVLEGLGHD